MPILNYTTEVPPNRSIAEIKSGIVNGVFIPEGVFVKTGDLERQLAKQFGVNFYTIRDIRLGRLWKDVEVEYA